MKNPFPYQNVKSFLIFFKNVLQNLVHIFLEQNNAFGMPFNPFKCWRQICTQIKTHLMTFDLMSTLQYYIPT